MLDFGFLIHHRKAVHDTFYIFLSQAQRGQNFCNHRLEGVRRHVFFVCFVISQEGNHRSKLILAVLAFKVLEPLFRNSIAPLERLHDGVFPVDEFRVPMDLGQLIFFEVCIEADDPFPVFGREFAAFVADRFPERVEDVRRVDELDFPLAFRPLIL